MTLRSDRLIELIGRLREAYEIGSPLVVQQRLLADFSVFLELRGSAPPPFHLPLNQEVLSRLETGLGKEGFEMATPCQGGIPS
ncbi:MAG: hypothetical protein HXY18_03735 [Bryobacteraceae bacterium]|nr:hypothetical protein [Bryobacteraceae bacterium]